MLAQNSNKFVITVSIVIDIYIIVIVVTVDIVTIVDIAVFLSMSTFCAFTFYSLENRIICGSKYSYFLGIQRFVIFADPDICNFGGSRYFNFGGSRCL